MALLRNAKAFKNWYCLYLARYGFLRQKFVLKTRGGETILVRPGTEDASITKAIFAKKNYENDFVSIEPGSVVVDVGANIGAFALFASRTAARVLAFEPEPDNFQCLCKNIEINNRTNIIPEQAAVAQETGSMDFRIAEKRDSSAHSFYLEKYENTIPVQVLSLADLIAKHDLPRINFLKLDCEGAEIDIIEYLSQETAERIDQIAMEFHQRNGYSNQDVVKKLEELGFHVRLGKRENYIYARRKEDRS